MSNTMNVDARLSYLRSLLWLGLFVIVFISVSAISGFIWMSFAGENLRAGSVAFLLEFKLFLSPFAALAALIVFSIPLGFQIIILRLAAPYFGKFSYIVLAFLLPLIAVVTWYCYDYLIPSDPMQTIATPHGLTRSRYLATLVYFVPVSIFCNLYWLSDSHMKSNRPLIFLTLAAVVIAGVVSSLLSQL